MTRKMVRRASAIRGALLSTVLDLLGETLDDWEGVKEQVTAGMRQAALSDLLETLATAVSIHLHTEEKPLIDLVAGLRDYTFGWSDGRLRVG